MFQRWAESLMRPTLIIRYNQMHRWREIVQGWIRRLITDSRFESITVPASSASNRALNSVAQRRQGKKKKPVQLTREARGRNLG